MNVVVKFDQNRSIRDLQFWRSLSGLSKKRKCEFRMIGNYGLEYYEMSWKDAFEMASMVTFTLRNHGKKFEAVTIQISPDIPSSSMDEFFNGDRSRM